MKEHQGMKLTGCEEKLEFLCKKHGLYHAKPFMYQGKVRKIKPPCPECEKAIIKEKQTELDIRKENSFLEKVPGANIPFKFCKLNFRDFDTTVAEDAAHALQVVQTYYEKFFRMQKKGTCLMLCGFPGTGKTHLSCTLLNRLLRENKDVFYTTAYEMLSDVRSTYNRTSKISEKQVLCKYKKYDLLVIDEIGVHDNSRKDLVILFEIIDGRYRSNLPTVLISNLVKEQFKEYVGERAFDRLNENSGVFLAFNWDSYRR